MSSKEMSMPMIIVACQKNLLLHHTLVGMNRQALLFLWVLGTTQSQSLVKLICIVTPLGNLRF